MIRRCDDDDFEVIYEIINDAAQAYEGIIPPDLWSEPYMSRDELQSEITDGVVFWGWEEGGDLAGVMAIQDVQDVTLIRHSYVRTTKRNQGIGEGYSPTYASKRRGSCLSARVQRLLGRSASTRTAASD